MLSPSQKRGSLAGRLLLSTALVAISLGYGWWQRHNAAGPVSAMMAMPKSPAPSRLVPVPHSPGTVSPAATEPARSVAPNVNAAIGAGDTPRQVSVAPQPQKPFAVAKAAPQTMAPSVAPGAPVAQSQQNAASPSSSAPSVLTTQQALQMNLPTESPSPPLPSATGTPEAGASAPVPAGTHLEDGEYVSDRQELAWGDLKVKITIHGGLIIGVQILQYPDHRSQSLYLSQMAGPILESEVIKSQKAQVDTVSSATDTSYSFQDTVANAIMKATRE